MPELSFQVEAVGPRTNAATPQLTFKLRVANAALGEPIQSMLLRCQIQVEPVRRRYTPQEQQRLVELFGEPERWSQTLHPLLWENLSVSVPGFTGSTVIDLFVPCTLDFNVAMTKYSYGLEEGDLPTSLLFSGTVFFQNRGVLQIMQIPWNSEARYSVPVRAWKQTIDAFYADTAWISLRRDTFNLLYDYKTRQGIPSWEQVIEQFLGTRPGPHADPARGEDAGIKVKS